MLKITTKEYTDEKQDEIMQRLISTLQQVDERMNEGDVAEYCGINQATFSRLKNCKMPLTRRFLRSLAEKMGTTIEALEGINDNLLQDAKDYRNDALYMRICQLDLKQFDLIISMLNYYESEDYEPSPSKKRK